MLPILRTKLRCQAAIEGITISLALGLIDVHSTNEDWFNPLLAYLVAGFVLGLRHAGRAWQAWIPLGFCYYLMHRAAIACGYQPPYVEVDAASAGASLIVTWPAGLGLGLGVFVFYLSRLTQPRKGRPNLDGSGMNVRASPQPFYRSGSPSRHSTVALTERRPASRFTVSRLMVVVAVVGIHLAFVRLLLTNDRLFGFCTIYSERFSESRFNTLRVGMTTGEVEAIVGRPMSKVPRNQPTGPRNEETWHYSSRHDYTANYWRRWVLFENGKVVAVINDFWVD